MDSRPHLRRFTGLTVLFLGLLGLFSTLTLASQDKVGWAVLTAVGGVVFSVAGLRLLAREST
jgi:predicted membrane channel-forming protein YqfA (hemolysin III family)